MAVIRSWRHVVAIACVVVGIVMSANAIVSGPRAFGAGLPGVVVMASAGGVCVAVGGYRLWTLRRETKERRVQVRDGE